MRNLIALELKRNRLRPYHIATLICGVTMLGFQYLMAAIPYMDPTEPDAELFSQYPFLMGITCLVCMAIFSILSAVMASRFVVEEYSGKRAILLLSYPISRKRVLCAKLMLVFAYTAGGMLLCGATNLFTDKKADDMKSGSARIRLEWKPQKNLSFGLMSSFDRRCV